MSPAFLSGSAIDLQAEAITKDLDDLLTVQDVAKLLKVPPSWVYEHTRARAGSGRDRLPRIKLGKYVRFDPRAVHAYLARRAKNA